MKWKWKLMKILWWFCSINKQTCCVCMNLLTPNHQDAGCRERWNHAALSQWWMQTVSHPSSFLLLHIFPAVKRPALSSDPTTVLRQLLGLGKCSFLSSPCLWPLPVFKCCWSPAALNSQQNPCTVCESEEYKPDVLMKHKCRNYDVAAEGWF